MYCVEEQYNYFLSDNQGGEVVAYRIAKAPRECIDYVILHELCHIAEHNHSDKFYRLMHQIMPEWKSVKARLDGMASRLLDGMNIS